MSTRTLAAKAALILATATSAVAVAAGPASANCAHPHSDKDPGFESVTGAGSTGVAMRAGPHIGCDLIRRIPNGHMMDMHCYTVGETVFGVSTWSFVRYNNGGGDWFGWVSDYYLTNRGSTRLC